MALAFAPATVSEKSHECLAVANGLMSLSRMLCRLPDYAASCMRVAVGMAFHDRCVGINV
jgi:hypothetical protein